MSFLSYCFSCRMFVVKRVLQSLGSRRLLVEMALYHWLTYLLMYISVRVYLSAMHLCLRIVTLQEENLRGALHSLCLIIDIIHECQK